MPVCVYAEYGGVGCESESNFSMYRVQTKKLQYNEKQKERSRKIRNEKVLQILPSAHTSQRNKVVASIHLINIRM